MKKRIEWIDIAKGICMISVVLGHLGKEYLNFVYAYHLTTFFLLAGYTLKKKELTAEYLNDKFKRLMTPYFITCFFVTVMDIVNAIIIHRNVSTVGITNVVYKNIMRAFFASGTYTTFGEIEVGTFIGAIWFLPAMFFALIFTQYVINKTDKWRIRAAIGIIIALLGCITAPFIWFPFSVQAGMTALPFILFGMWMKEYELLEKLNVKHYVLFAIIFLVGCMTNYSQVFWLVTCTMKDYLFSPVVAIVSSLLVIGISRKIEHSKILSFIGKNSMIVLCVHLFEMNTITKYFSYVRREWLHMDGNLLIWIVMEFSFILVLTWIIVHVMKADFSAKKSTGTEKRNSSLDIMRAILITIMILGHRTIDGGLSKFIYSFHMMAFVIISGYFFKERPEEAMGIKSKKLMKGLYPYSVFGILYMIINDFGWIRELKQIMLGVSFTNKVFTDVSTIGPVYFILMLFCVKVIYVLIVRYIRSELFRNIAVMLLVIAGVTLGKQGFWLPWSLDCAMFSLIFYHAGYYMNKYNVLEWCKNNPYTYFVLAPVWAFMIWRGGMELAVRNYSMTGLTIVGAIAAFLVMYMFCEYLSNMLITTARQIFQWIGQSTVYILIIHTLWGPKIVSFTEWTMGLNQNNIFHLVIILGIQIISGTMIFLIHSKLKNKKVGTIK